MNIQITESNNFAIVSVEGRIDITNAIEFEKKMIEIIEEGHSRIILDCSELQYISSSGLRVLLAVRKKISSLNGMFRLCTLQPLLIEIFNISGFSSIFSVFIDKKTAMIEL